jgi:hypothetical protein
MRWLGGFSIAPGVRVAEYGEGKLEAPPGWNRERCCEFGRTKPLRPLHLWTTPMKHSTQLVEIDRARQ